jgi:Uma2 family endonuclease
MSTTTQPTSFYPTLPGWPPLAQLSLDQFEAMDSSGFFGDERIELLEGVLVKKMPPNPPHSTFVYVCIELIRALLSTGWHARQEQPLRVPAASSRPHPDIAVVRGHWRDYSSRHPDAVDAAMVVEVSDTTLAADRAKAAIYAAGDIPVYWIVNVEDRVLEVYSQPSGGVYHVNWILDEHQKVDLVIAGQVVGQIPVADLLP